MYPILLGGETYQRFTKGELIIDCSNMQLSRKVPESTPTYGGPGSITQTGEGRLALKLYCSQSPDHTSSASTPST